MDMTNLEALQTAITIGSVFMAPFFAVDALRFIDRHTNLLRRKHRIMNTRHMNNPVAYLEQFELTKCKRYGYKVRREVGANARRNSNKR